MLSGLFLDDNSRSYSSYSKQKAQGWIIGQEWFRDTISWIGISLNWLFVQLFSQYFLFHSSWSSRAYFILLFISLGFLIHWLNIHWQLQIMFFALLALICGRSDPEQIYFSNLDKTAHEMVKVLSTRWRFCSCRLNCCWPF